MSTNITVTRTDSWTHWLLARTLRSAHLALSFVVAMSAIGCVEEPADSADSAESAPDGESQLTSESPEAVPSLQALVSAPADQVLSTGSTVYSRKRSNGDVYRHNGATWVRVGGPGRQFVLVGATLYGLTIDQSAIYRYSGSGDRWDKVGDAASAILRCGSHLCATNQRTRDLYRLEFTGWRRIGGSAAVYASTASDLFRLSADRTRVDKYAGFGTVWNTIGGPARSIVATSTALYGVDPNTGELRSFADGFASVSTPAQQWVGVGSTLYRLASNGTSVWKRSGTTWTRIGNAALAIFGGPAGSLYALSPANSDIHVYTNGWVSIGQP